MRFPDLEIDLLRAFSLTRDGERLLVSARQMLEFNDAVVRDMRKPPAAGTLRLGIAEDFIPNELPKLLARFSRLYPGMHIDLMTGLSCSLLAAYDEDRLDAVIAKKDGQAQRGRVIWREPLVWLASADFQVDPTRMDRGLHCQQPDGRSGCRRGRVGSHRAGQVVRAGRHADPPRAGPLAGAAHDGDHGDRGRVRSGRTYSAARHLPGGKPVANRSNHPGRLSFPTLQDIQSTAVWKAVMIEA